MKTILILLALCGAASPAFAGSELITAQRAYAAAEAAEARLTARERTAHLAYERAKEAREMASYQKELAYEAFAGAEDALHARETDAR